MQPIPNYVPFDKFKESKKKNLFLIRAQPTMILFHTFRRFRKPTLILKAILSKYTVIVRSKLKSRLEEKKNAHFRGECFDHLWEALKIIAKIHFIDLKSSLRGDHGFTK